MIQRKDVTLVSDIPITGNPMNRFPSLARSLLALPGLMLIILCAPLAGSSRLTRHGHSIFTRRRMKYF